jgi:twitching motility protein PilI
MGQISEIFRVPTYTHLPGVKSWVLGVSNFRGQLVPLIDLAGFLGLKPTVSLRNRRVVVLQREEMVVGVVVDSVEGMQHFLVESRFEQADEDIPKEMSPYLLGGYRRDIDDWQVFDFSRLLEAESFMQVAA